MRRSIFVNYRRGDGGSDANAITAALRQRFGDGAVFMDTSSIEAGTAWPSALKTALEGADVVLAVIGPEWLRVGTSEWGERRIDHPDDWVRQELAFALESDKTVIPVLVRGGKIPPAAALPGPIKGLPLKQAVSLHHEHWADDVSRLVERVAVSLGHARPRPERLGATGVHFEGLRAPNANEQRQQGTSSAIGWLPTLSGLPVNKRLVPLLVKFSLVVLAMGCAAALAPEVWKTAPELGDVPTMTILLSVLALTLLTAVHFEMLNFHILFVTARMILMVALLHAVSGIVILLRAKMAPWSRVLLLTLVLLAVVIQLTLSHMPYYWQRRAYGDLAFEVLVIALFVYLASEPFRTVMR